MRGTGSRVLGALVVLAAALLLAAPSQAFQQEFDQTYALGPGGWIEVRNVNGSVTISGWERNEVEVRAVKTAEGHEADLKRVAIEVSVTPQAVQVTTRYPQDEGVEVAVDYSIHVPHKTLVRYVATINGAVRLAGVASASQLRTVNGDIEVYDGAGSIAAQTINGNVRLELRGTEDGSASAETTNGSIVLALPQDARADLEVLNYNGNFRSELPVIMRGGLLPREMRGKIGGGGEPVLLRTVNGGIRVVVLRSTM
jgi:hypothetical protein